MTILMYLVLSFGVSLIFIFYFFVYRKDKQKSSKSFFDPINTGALPEREAQMLRLINHYRLLNKRRELLAEANHQYMAEMRYDFQCENLNGISHNLFYYHAKYLYRVGIKKCAENLGYDFASVDSAFRAFKESKKHNANMLDKKWKYVGIVCDKNKKDKEIYVLVFGY